jgi:hypothetical protein
VLGFLDLVGWDLDYGKSSGMWRVLTMRWVLLWLSWVSLDDFCEGSMVERLVEIQKCFWVDGNHSLDGVFDVKPGFEQEKIL